MHGFVLQVVVLETENLSSSYMEDLADIPVGARPNELISPRLFHPIGYLGHSGSLARWVQHGREYRWGSGTAGGGAACWQTEERWTAGRGTNCPAAPLPNQNAGSKLNVQRNSRLSSPEFR